MLNIVPYNPKSSQVSMKDKQHLPGSNVDPMSPDYWDYMEYFKYAGKTVDIWKFERDVEPDFIHSFLPHCKVHLIGLDEANRLIGKMKTLIDSLVIPERQNKAAKDMVSQLVWEWYRWIQGTGHEEDHRPDTNELAFLCQLAAQQEQKKSS